ncbi:hypothetical protein D3C80_2043880 [compost metagenome]
MTRLPVVWRTSFWMGEYILLEKNQASVMNTATRPIMVAMVMLRILTASLVRLSMDIMETYTQLFISERR